MKLSEPKFFFSFNTAAWLKKVLPTTQDFPLQKKIADRALRHTFLVGEDSQIYMFHNVTKGWVHFKDVIDWGKFRNTEKSAKLNRLGFLNSLGFMYFLYGGPQYARKSLYLLRDWCKKNPLNPDTKDQHSAVIWSSLNAAIRVVNLLWMYFFLKDSKQVSSNDKFFIIETIFSHAKYLHAVNSNPRYQFGNWQIQELVALAHLGILFPEFKEAKAWKNLAYKNLEKQIKRQFFSDGVHAEGSLSYHITVAQLYMDALLLAKINRIRVSRKLMNFTKKMIDFVVNVIRPDGTFPLINDSYIVDIKTFLLCANHMFSHNKWAILPFSPTLGFILRFADNLKNQGQRRHKQHIPSEMKKSKLFPEAGFAVMRDKDNTQQLFFDAYPGWFFHSHAGKLGFQLYAHGKPIIVDAGNCSYDYYDYTSWYKRTVAHNTIQVNNRDQTLLRDIWQWDVNYNLNKIPLYPNVKVFMQNIGWPRVSIDRWISNEAFDFIEAKHEGYRNLMNPLIHSRKILFIKGKYWIIIDELKVENEQWAFANHYEFLLHFFPGKVQMHSKEKIANVKNGNVGILVVPLYRDDIDEVVLTKGKIIYNNEPCLSPFLKYIKHNRSTAVFFTMLLPYKGRCPKVKIEELRIQQAPSKNEKLGVAVNIDGNTVYFIYQPHCQHFADFKRRINFRGRILWLESKKRKVNSFLAIDAKEATLLDKVLFRDKNAKTIWKKN